MKNKKLNQESYTKFLHENNRIRESDSKRSNKLTELFDLKDSLEREIHTKETENKSAVRLLNNLKKVNAQILKL